VNKKILVVIVVDQALLIARHVVVLEVSILMMILEKIQVVHAAMVQVKPIVDHAVVQALVNFIK